MDNTYYGVLPFDPETETAYINAVGSNELEAVANLCLIDISDEGWNRIKFLPIKITIE